MVKRQIAIESETWKALNQLKEPGDTFDKVIQRLVTPDELRTRAIEELATATAEVTSRTRDISDLALRVKEYAKKQLTDAKTIDEWRKKHSDLVEDYREIKQTYNALRDRRACDLSMAVK
ncbi:hypothetical protein ES703_112854 [subsurface metagenome]